MESEILNKLGNHIKNIEQFNEEIQITEQFFFKKDLNHKVMDEVFWNHILSLINRIDSNEQNDLEVYDMEEIGENAIELMEEYVIEMSRYRKFNVTNFEKMLLSIYTQRMLNEEEK